MKKLIKTNKIIIFFLCFSSCMEWGEQRRQAFGPTDVEGMAEFFESQGLNTFAQYYRRSARHIFLEDSIESLTIFAPTDDAFAEAMSLHGSPDIEDFMARMGGINFLPSLIGKHIFLGSMYSEELRVREHLYNFHTQSFLFLDSGAIGENLAISGSPKFAEQNIPIPFNNGVLHKIDKVLKPSFRGLRNRGFVEECLHLGIHGFLSALVYEETVLDFLTNGTEFSLFLPHEKAVREFLNEHHVRSFAEFMAKKGGREGLKEYLSRHVILSQLSTYDFTDKPQLLTLKNGENCWVSWKNNRFHIELENGQVFWTLLNQNTRNGTLLVINEALSY
jgi:hypothetical protein